MNYELYIILFILIIIIFTILFLFKDKLFYRFKVKEGFNGRNRSNTDKDKIPDVISSNLEKLSDDLLINKYKSSYEDTIIYLDDYIKYSILQETIKNAESISKNPLSNQSLEAISNMNKLKQFRDTLTDAMDTVDKSN